MLATKTAPRRPQDGPGGLQGGASGGVCISRSPKAPPGRLPGLPPPWEVDFGRFLFDFWKIFLTNFDKFFGTILGGFWKVWGRILGSFCRQICLLFWGIFNSPLFFACGLSCNARPPCSRSAGSIRRASLASDRAVSNFGSCGR